MKGTVEAARERKRQVLADNPDAAALGRDDADEDGKPGKRMADAGGESAPDVEEAETTSIGRVHGHGCAGCATGGPRNLGLVLVVALLLVRRRRR
jgi:MYXO-CTERM domain-containing protein